MPFVTPPTRLLAGISVPDTPLITNALSFVRAVHNDFTYNHVVRSLLFALHLGSLLPSPSPPDTELIALASILHDLGWEALATDAHGVSTVQIPNPAVSRDKRFEVDSANAGRDFVAKNGKAEEWDEVRLQLLWDAVVLHTTPSIGMHKQAEVRIVGLGPLLDFLGPDRQFGLGEAVVVKRGVWDQIVGEYPRDGFRQGVKEVMCHLCREKPGTTYDNFVGQFGERFVEGFSTERGQFIEVMLGGEGAE
jgi:hypothetical protein